MQSLPRGARAMKDNDASGLQVGELAHCAGLTVRALHYYDAIGLLSPSTRAPSGYRVYSGNDIVRLYRIQALRRFGLGLPDIAACLDDDRASSRHVLARHIEMIGQQVQRTEQLRAHLIGLHGQLESGTSPTTQEWKTALHLLDAIDSVPAMDCHAFRRQP